MKYKDLSNVLIDPYIVGFLKLKGGKYEGIPEIG